MLRSDFVSGADAPRANIKTYSCAIHFERNRLNVGEPGTPCMLLGVAYPIAEAQSFATHITFYSQFRTP